jgi:signal transduction histidine kinase
VLGAGCWVHFGRFRTRPYRDDIFVTVSGIEFSICKKKAENHGGFIMATGVPDEGSTFTVYFPAEENKILM